MATLREVLEFAGERAKRVSPDDYALDFIRDLHEDGVQVLEDSRKNYADANEDALSDFIVATMRTAFPGVSREELIHGHVDIALRHPLRMTHVLASEAKVIGPKGFAWYREGLTKLVGKYNSGRSPHTLMLCYCRKRDAHAEMLSFAEQVKQEKTADYVRDLNLAHFAFSRRSSGAFATLHRASGSEINVFHVWVNLYTMTDSELLR